MAFSVYTKDEVQIGILEQSAWGTAPSAAGAFKILDVDVVGFDPDIVQALPERSNVGSRVPVEANVVHHFKRTVPKVTLAGILKQGDAAEMIHAVTQNLTSQGGATAYEKVFRFAATQPDFTAISATTSAGFINGICIRPVLVSSASHLIYDAICRSLTLSCDPRNNNGALHFSAEFVGRGQISWTFNPTQTWTTTAQTWYFFSDLNLFTRTGTSYQPISWSITVSNNATPASVDAASAGKFLTWALPKYDISAKFTCLWESGMEALAPDTVYRWAVQWGADAVTGHLLLYVDGKIRNATDEYIDGLRCRTFDVYGCKTASVGTDYGWSASVADGVSKSW